MEPVQIGDIVECRFITSFVWTRARITATTTIGFHAESLSGTLRLFFFYDGGYWRRIPLLDQIASI